MFCKRCGRQIPDNAIYCPYCGANQNVCNNDGNKNLADEPNIWWAVLSFIIPVVGLVLWLVWQNDKPNQARMCRNGFFAFLALLAVYIIIVIVVILATSL